jgi:Fur family ferric uptake transcriptional regulator
VVAGPPETVAPPETEAQGARDYAALLRQHGVQVTAQRIAVLEAVAARPHATAEMVAAAVRADLGAISRQAVYSALTTLVNAGLARRLQPAGSAARYEARAGDNHHHLICRDCGLVVDVDCALGYVPCLTPQQDHGFLVEQAEVSYLGRCPTCRGRESVPPPAALAPHRDPGSPKVFQNL